MEISKENEPKNIVIACPNVDFANSLKKFFERQGLIVVDIVVLLEDLAEKLETFHLKDISIEGILITSDIAKKGSDKRLEFLSDYLLTVRTKFSQAKIIFLSNEPEGHPLLAELVNMGIYDIILKQQNAEQSLDVNQIIRSFYDSTPFSKVFHLRNFNESIPWRKIYQAGEPIKVDVKVVRDSRQEEKVAIVEQTVETSSLQEKQPVISEIEEAPKHVVEEFRSEDIHIPIPSEKKVGFKKNVTSGVIPTLSMNTKLVSIISPSSTGKSFLLVHLLQYLSNDVTVLDKDNQLEGYPVQQQCYTQLPSECKKMTIIESLGEKEVLDRSDVIIYIHTPNAYENEKNAQLMREALSRGTPVLPIMNMWSDNIPVSPKEMVGRDVFAVLPYYPEWIEKSWANKLLDIPELKKLAANIELAIER
ncbi:hypothetical protein AM501_23945 [Aneurinibacillus migulanus]|uniref:hypothetical protein n=1 Tax=Aneurinibacillus migulanus TaxID=47500 RepID=UPI0005BC7C19|nr:hypothetical protein [Aneurinibacillus migulanus]KIV58939.1 hypothetical protein TS64_04035 [Aneurinibacillus migulanus]KPD05829.1 hypothetical protein AM501_23945 [Aneurinibacillus migulanus]